MSVIKFEKLIGVSNGYVNAMRKGVGGKKLDKILEVFPELNRNWLLFGEGEMLKTLTPLPMNSTAGIPLVSAEAVAGFGNSDFAIEQTMVLANYVIPDFKQISFMIRVTGDSMMPNLKSGDIVAVRTIYSRSYIEWNKPHLIATRDNGMLIKRLRQSQKEEHFLLVSDNTDYAPFDIPEVEITGIAIVVGVIRLE